MTALSVLGMLAGANDTNITRRVWRVVTGIRSAIGWLNNRGVSVQKINKLLSQENDVSMDQIADLLRDFDANLDDLQTEIDAKRDSESNTDDDSADDDHTQPGNEGNPGRDVTDHSSEGEGGAPSASEQDPVNQPEGE